MRKLLLILFITTPISEVLASVKNSIIENLKNIENVSFNFEQNINGKTENGNCIIEYPKKFFANII